MNPFVIQPPIIAHPWAVDAVVLARRVAIDFFFTRTDQDIAARCATRTDALGFLEKPHTHLETEILRRERANRTDVHRVQSIMVIERRARERGDGVVAAAVYNAERVVPCNVLRETKETRPKHATLRIEHDAR